MDTFLRHGADLDPAGKKRLEELDVELTQLTTRFSENVLDSTNATALASATGVEESYQRLVNGFGTEVASVRRLAANQQVIRETLRGASSRS